MTAQFTREAEVVSRRTAQWGSLAAAVLFGVAYLTDKPNPFYTDPALYAFTAFVVLAFVGYAVAWWPRWETLGSLVALLSTIGALYAAYVAAVHHWSPALLGLAAPAVLHLAAVVFHRVPTKPAPAA